MTAVLAILVFLFVGLLIYAIVSGPRLPSETDEIIESVLEREIPDIVAGRTGTALSGGLKIWYESISPNGPPTGTILLNSALGGHALDWPPKFVQAFIEAGYRVVRYDPRGTGMSDWMETWSFKHPYSLADMAGDAIEVLNVLEIQKAHVVGLSMGGMIAQEIAIQCPERVASLTLMMTSGFIGDPEVPGLSSRFFFASFVKGVPLWKYRLLGGEKNLIKERIAKQISVTGYDGLDVRETAEVLLYDLRKRRGLNLRAILQHQSAVTVSGPRYDELRKLDIPTLVIHGTADRFIPVEHGKKLADVIPNASGMWLAGVGHVFPVPDMQSLMNRIFSHLGNQQSSNLDRETMQPDP